jgi:hypothetical protein
MTQDDEVRLLEIATKLVTDWLGFAATSSIVAFGVAIGELTRQCDNVEDIRAVGELLESLTDRDRKAIEKGERWKRGSRTLSPEEGQKALRGMTLDQLDAFATRLGYGPDEVISWAMGSSEIHGGALWALGDVDEMAKITGETR